MRATLKLAAKSAWARRLTLAVTLVAIALSSALLLAVERVRGDARASFAQTVSGVDLVVGARSGGLQLMLHAIFHSGGASNSMRWDSYETLARHPAVAWAVPLALGDSHRGFAVLGTRTDYFTRFRYGDNTALTLATGKPFAELFDVVIGSAVAKELRYSVGDSVVLNHGMSDSALPLQHGDKPFRIVGILAPTGTPVDRTLHVSLEAISAIHLDWIAGAPLPGLSIPAAQARKFDLKPKEITAMLIGLKERSDVFRLQRHINTLAAEPLLAVMPGVALDELWQTLGMVEATLLAVSALVVVVGLAGLMATMLASLNERRRELAILRSLGASPADLFLMLTAEGLLVTLLGAVIGCILLAAGIHFFAPVLQARFGVILSWRLPAAGEWWLLASILATGLVASLVPGWRAWRMSLADGLTPRN